MHEKRNIHQTFYHKSRYRGIDISQYGWTNISIPRPSSLLSEAFSQASRQRWLEIYTKPILVVRKNQESLFETFSKRSPPPSKNLSSLQKYIFPTVAILDISTKPNRSFSYSSRFSLFSSDSTGGREYLRSIYRESKMERGRRFLMHRSLTMIRNRKWDRFGGTLHRFFRGKR